MDGKFAETLDVVKPGISVIFDCIPRMEPTDQEGVRIVLSVSSANKEHLVYWNLRSQISHLYFGVQFHQAGTRIKID